MMNFQKKKKNSYSTKTETNKNLEKNKTLLTSCIHWLNILRPKMCRSPVSLRQVIKKKTDQQCKTAKNNTDFKGPKFWH